MPFFYFSKRSVFGQARNTPDRDQVFLHRSHPRSPLVTVTVVVICLWSSLITRTRSQQGSRASQQGIYGFVSDVGACWRFSLFIFLVWVQMFHQHLELHPGQMSKALVSGSSSCHQLGTNIIDIHSSNAAHLRQLVSFFHGFGMFHFIAPDFIQDF